MLYDSESMRRFAGLELNEDAMPSDTSMLRFRHLLERYELMQAMLVEVNAMLGERTASADCCCAKPRSWTRR